MRSLLDNLFKLFEYRPNLFKLATPYGSISFNHGTLVYKHRAN